MQIGRIGINVEALADISKDEFIKMFSGQSRVDINEAWKEFKKEARAFKSEDKTVKKQQKKSTPLD